MDAEPLAGCQSGIPGTLKVMARGAPEARQDIEDLKVALEKVETTLLSEFWKWARNNDVKIRSVKTQTVDLDERLTNIEERVSELERRRKAS